MHSAPVSLVYANPCAMTKNHARVFELKTPTTLQSLVNMTVTTLPGARVRIMWNSELGGLHAFADTALCETDGMKKSFCFLLLKYRNRNRPVTETKVGELPGSSKHCATDLMRGFRFAPLIL